MGQPKENKSMYQTPRIASFLLLSIALITSCKTAPVGSLEPAEAGCPDQTELGDNVRCFDGVKDLGTLEEHVNAYASTRPEHSVLAVFDIDDTLLTSSQFFGGDTWFRWQSKLPVELVDGSEVVISERDVQKCKFAKLNALYEFAMYEPTQPDAGKVVSKLLDEHTVIALTSRSPGARSGTQRELERAKISFSDDHLMADSISLTFEEHGRGVSYSGGIVMSSGLDKGLILEEILKKTSKSFDIIFVIDDGESNLSKINNHWKGKSTQIRLYHYTRIEKAVSPQELKRARESNDKLNAFLRHAYPDRWQEFSKNICND